jgi:hypothetical protein
MLFPLLLHTRGDKVQPESEPLPELEPELDPELLPELVLEPPELELLLEELEDV